MTEYDADQPPHPEDWLSLNEQERIAIVADYHYRAGVELPNATLHAAIHTVVENQVAIGGDLPVGATLERLMSEGLDRHDAIHAIGSVLADQIYGILKGENIADDTSADYFAKLERLTARDWRGAG